MKNDQEEYIMRQTNKRLELIMKIQDSVLRSQQLVEKVFLNYKFLFALFNQQIYFSVANYCYQKDFLSDLYDFMNITNARKAVAKLQDIASENTYLVAIAGLIQSIVISLNESLNQYPKTIGNQICSKINCLNGLSVDFSIFIRDCNQISVKDCSLIAHTQISQLSESRTRSVHNFFKKIIDFQDLGKRDNVQRVSFIYDKTVTFFDWNNDEKKTKILLKEIEIPSELPSQYEILRVFEFKENSNKFGIIVATKTSIQCFDDNTREISKQKIQPGELVKDVLIVNSERFIVYYENKSYINIFETFSKRGLPIHQHKFESNVTFFYYNKIKHEAWANIDYDKKLYISVYLENNDIIIYQVLNDLIGINFNKFSYKKII